MKVLKWFLILAILLAAGLVGGGYLLSSKFAVMRSVHIAAAPDKIYALVAEPRNWNQWAPWNRRDPAMQISYSGPPSGQGAQWTWKSASQGDGRMMFTAVVPGEYVAYELYLPDFGTTSGGDFFIKPDGKFTRVTWSMSGDMGSNPIYHWFALLSDRMLGKDFDEGLNSLKELAEKP